MPELGSLINDTAERLEVEVNGSIVAVAYHPARITPLWLSDAMVTDDPLSLARSLAAVLTEWDVVENGQPVPLNADTLATFPFPVLGAFADAIGTAASGSEEGNVSSSSQASGAPASTIPASTEQNHSSLDTSRPPVTAT
jgi:hypothetical protein